MSFGNFSSVFLPTHQNGVRYDFNIHILPEIIDLGVKNGRPVCSLEEPYAMVPDGFDPAKPAKIWFHKPDIYSDLFMHINDLSVPRQILTRLKDENAILLYMHRPTTQGLNRLREDLDQCPLFSISTHEEIIDRFVQHLGIQEYQVASTSQFSNDAIYHGSRDLIVTDAGKFNVHTADEVVAVPLPQAVLDLLLPDFAALPADAQPIVRKYLTHYALVSENLDLSVPPKLRVHSSCATGDINNSGRCDCGSQLRETMDAYGREGLVFVVHDAEGRGVLSLAVKMEFYKASLEFGLDTYDAMEKFGYPRDLRNYQVPVDLLKSMGIRRAIVLSNNVTNKLPSLQAAGLEILSRSDVHVSEVPDTATNYLRTKKERGGHKLPVHLQYH